MDIANRSLSFELNMQKMRVVRSIENCPILHDLHPVLARVYAARGIKSAHDLDYQLTRLLHYRSLKNIELAAAILATAVIDQQRILIIGDFDTDGATSSALAVSALRSFGAMAVDYLIPNRFEYGYGLTPEIVELALVSKQPELIITVDNGISSHEGVAVAKKAGVQVVITDHHLPGAVLPNADAIVNPQLADDAFPSKNLAGVGVIFYVMLALRQALRERLWFDHCLRREPTMRPFLDLVAVGTIADLVTLDHNNRLLVYQGLQWIKSGQARPGIYALLKLAKRELTQLSAGDLGFCIAPRLNAAGRLADMSLGVACLLADDANTAYEKALTLSRLNEERRAIEAGMQQEAFSALEKVMQQKLLGNGVCLFDPKWHQGIIGLLASRITERLNRPSIIFAPAQQAHELKGSARSIPGVHIRDVLERIATREPQLIAKFGGHAMAAGLTLQRNALADFAQAFQLELQNHVDDAHLRGVCYTDGTLASQDFSIALAEILCYHAGPWGQGFPEPVFEGHFTLLAQRVVGNKHLKMTLALKEWGQEIEAIAFNINLAHWPNHRANRISATYRLGINSYQGHKKLQLVIERLESQPN
jgi:single-stranded-DNA-specific exonuclease